MQFIGRGYMQHFLNIFKIPAIVLIALLLACCKKNESIIPRKEFTYIVRDMYLADQYLEFHEKFRAQADTLILYEGIFSKYGYTYEDYKNSVKYYLQDGDVMYKMHAKAKQLLIDERDEIKRLIAIENGKIIDWWALDTIKRREVNNLWKEPYLRSVKWLSQQDAPITWNFFTDTTEFDVPMNSNWWQKNVTLNIPNNSDTLYPILTKDYLIALEINKKKEEIILKKEAEKERKRKIKEEQEKKNEKKKVKEKKKRNKQSTSDKSKDKSAIIETPKRATPEKRREATATIEE